MLKKAIFDREYPGELLRNFEGHLTFVPAAFPPAIPLTSTLFKLVSDVANALGRLEGTAQALPDPKIVIRSFVRREAQLSSYIENTYASYEDVAIARQDVQQTRNVHVIETLNAERAIEAGVEAVFRQGYPINNHLLRQMHKLLLDGVRGHEVAGAFRQRQVYIGKEQDGPDGARFVPPPPHLIDELMRRLETYMNADNELPPLVQIALIHYQFETIHPFEDGNGRLGRIMILLGLCQHRLLSLPLINASLHFERNKQQYYDALLAVSTRGDWPGWIAFVLEGLHVAATESMKKLAELMGLQRNYHEKVRSARNTSLLLTLVDNLFVLPVLTITDAARIMGVSYNAAKNSVQKLVDAGVLRAVDDSSPVRFVARDILQAVNPIPTRR
jgi:Fic family protein